jgi:ADP-ribosyl-[dinitrogen reductase] hydrolase
MSSSSARTSQSHPLQIATVLIPGKGSAIGLTLCPGKRDADALTGPWNRDLGIDVQAIRSWGANAVVCLMEDVELKLLGVEDLPSTIEAAGIRWLHLPIRDVGVPSMAFEMEWTTSGAELKGILLRGGRVLIHCRGGLGRSGMIAARLLFDLGMRPASAIGVVRKQRPGAIETAAQETYVMNLSRGSRPTHRRSRP